MQNLKINIPKSEIRNPKSILSFTKMSGAGNDFIVFDNRKNLLPGNLKPLVRRLCQRKFSIGADGVLILENDRRADFRLRYFNADGSSAEMCGNGARCIAKFAYELGVAGKKMSFVTGAGLISAEIKPDTVKVAMSQPHSIKLDFPLTLPLSHKGRGQGEGRFLTASFINTGVPHTVIFYGHNVGTRQALPLQRSDSVDVAELGRLIRFHKKFAPQGTNVNFGQVKNKHSLFLRTYERGVEEETFACGTGAVAAAIIAGLKGLVKPPVAVITGSKIKLIIDYQLIGSDIKDASLEGPAEITFEGEIEV